MIKPDVSGRWAAGIRISAADYQDDYYTLYGVGVRVDPESSIWVGVNLNYNISNYFSLELSTDFTEFDTELSALGLSGNAGDLRLIPVLLTGKWRLLTPPNNLFLPYFGLGIGYYDTSFDTNATVIESIYGPGAEVSVDNGFGYHAAVGFDIFVSENAAINIDLKYIWVEIDSKVNIPGFTESTFDLNGILFGAGFKVFF
jgi:outer membrane protein W